MNGEAEIEQEDEEERDGEEATVAAVVEHLFKTDLDDHREYGREESENFLFQKLFNLSLLSSFSIQGYRRLLSSIVVTHTPESRSNGGGCLGLQTGEEGSGRHSLKSRRRSPQYGKTALQRVVDIRFDLTPARRRRWRRM